ncbi:hypothetical protein D9611_006295 [Ephemerocybe angulata]|uniref:Uncharacterized protein n=1 Tax=Ephemerocybe angulata TaxID=980116 RepID=A0A8H5FGP0_9AGAR|nr:hypothetical protein D9611_006295 [Tulosesus angulatus]
MAILPPELVGEVLQHAWTSPMSVAEQKALLSSALLVSPSWAVTCMGILGGDVHILDRSFMEYYFQLLRGESILFQFGKSGHILNDLCRKVTIHVSNPDLPVRPYPSEPEAEKLLSDFLYRLKIYDGALPNLRSLKIQFQNVSCEDVFIYHRLIDFPPQVENLELQYAFNASIPRWMIPMPHFLSSGNNPTWTLPSIRHLRVTGGFDDLMKMVFVCPKIESFEMDACLYWDRKTKRDVRDPNLIRTLFFRGLPEQYEASLPRHVEGEPIQKLFVFTEDPVKSKDGSLTYMWWLSHDFSLGDIVDYENVQYISCKADEVA